MQRSHFGGHPVQQIVKIGTRERDEKLKKERQMKNP